MDGEGGWDSSGDSGSEGSWADSSDHSSGDSGRPLRREDFWAFMLLLSLCLSLLTGAFSLSELRYAIWGEIVEASVRESKVVQINQDRDQSTEKLSVAYSFAVERGEVVNASDELPGDWPRLGRTIDVQYLPGRRIHSRVAGHDNKSIYYVFLGSLAVLAGVIFKFYLEAKASERRPKRRYH